MATIHKQDGHQIHLVSFQTGGIVAYRRELSTMLLPKVDKLNRRQRAFH
jgi:hypothetical protein